MAADRASLSRDFNACAACKTMTLLVNAMIQLGSCRMKSVVLAFTALAIAAPASALSPSKFTIFADSFIDAGNIAIATGNTIPDPALGYWEGRFSDGPTWADQLGWANFGAPAAPSLAGGTNFAFGGARAAVDDVVSLGVIPGLQTQFGMFLASTGGVVDPDALYIINFGNNDVNAIQSGDTEGLTIAQYQAAYVNNMVGAVSFLNAAGAKYILLLGVPNPTEIEGQILQAQLDAALNFIEPSLTADLYRFSYFNFFIALQADPTQFGLPADLDFVTPCLVGELPGPDIDCTGYLSFDGIHVTSSVHLALANEIAKFTGLVAVPEPASWGMMIAGFGMIGFAARRRRAPLAA